MSPESIRRNPIQRLDRGTLTAQKDSVTGLNFAECWGLDATGNWRAFRRDDDGTGWALIQTRTANRVNEITDVQETRGLSWITPLYNRAGNMTRIPKPGDPTAYFTATYDAWNRLVKIEADSNTVAEYAYDGAKRRTLKKTYSGGQLQETRHFYYTEPARWQVVEERLESGGEISANPDRQFVWGLRYIDDLLLRDRDTSAPKNGTLDERLYALQDANWNVTALAGVAGAVQERYAYSAYGAPSVLTSSFDTGAASDYVWKVLYAGYRWDEEGALWQVRNRALLRALGWVQRDGLRYADGPNLYQYVRSRPLNSRDASGLDVTLEQGNNTRWQPPNDLFHMQICVDTWTSCRDSGPSGKICFSYACDPSKCRAEVYVTSPVPGAVVIRRKRTTCEQDGLEFARLMASVGDTSGYGFRANCITFSHMMFNLALGRELERYCIRWEPPIPHRVRRCLQWGWRVPATPPPPPAAAPDDGWVAPGLPGGGVAL